MKDVNTVTLVCRLTRDPELRSTPTGTSVCTLRVAFSTSRKDASGAWQDKPNYIDVTVWGSQGESCARYLSKGRQVAVLGHLEWREYERKEGGGKVQVIDITADQVQFLGGDGDGGQRSAPAQQPQASAGDIPYESPPAAPAAGTVDDDIPF